MANRPILKPSIELCLLIFFCYATVLICIGIFSSNKLHFYAGDIDDGANRLYLLSAITQALSAILAVLVTFTLVSTQLASQTFTPQIVSQKLRDRWFWGAIIIYVLAILWALFAKSELKWLKSQSDWDLWSVDIAVLSASFAILYIAPFFIATLRSLEPGTFVRRLLKHSLYEHLDDFMRKSVNEGMVNMLEEALRALAEHAIDELQNHPRAREAKAMRFAGQVTEIGRYACRRKDTEAWEKAMRWLTGLTEYCTQKQFRQAADIFNRGVDELYKYGLEHFSEKK